MTTDLTTRLAQVPLFASLDESGLQDVAELATEFEAKAGHVFIERGQPGNGLFVIEEGSVRIDLASGERVERKAGQFFGELSILADVPRSARVSAATDVRCVAIARRDLMELLHERPDIAVAMLREVAARLVDVTTQ